MTSDAESSLYFEKAYRAHSSGDDKISSVLLRHVTLTTYAHHELNVAVYYNLWRKSIGKLEEDKQATLAVEAFSNYIKDIGAENIPPFDFVKLSHIYINKGSLDGALKVMGLASASGYLTETIIVLQCWTIASRIAATVDAERYISFLCTSVTMESRGLCKGDEIILSTCDFPLKYLYLFCAAHLLRVAGTTKSADYKEECMNGFQSLLTEAYVFYFKEFKKKTDALIWFNSPDLWWEIGVDLLKSPFLLLAEEALWESYIRDTLNDRCPSKLLKCLHNTNRENAIVPLFEKAYKRNPWNLYVRARLVLEYRWQVVFAEQHFLLSKVQGCIRSWFTRRHFDVIRTECLRKLMIFQKKMDKASKKYTQQQCLKLHELLKIWSKNAKFLAWRKYNAARIIQTMSRRCISMSKFNVSKKRVLRANMTYIIAMIKLNDSHRIRILRRWHQLYLLNVRNRASDCISAMIAINGNSKKFLEALDILKAILRRRKYLSNKSVFYTWYSKFERKIRLRARVSIRFMVRNLYRKNEEIKRDRELQRKIDALARINKLSSFKPNPKLTYKKFFSIWFETYKTLKTIRLTAKHVKSFVKNMKRIIARKKDKKKIEHQRVMREISIAVTSNAIYRQFYKAYRKWRVYTVVLRLQRCFRIFLSKCRLLKRVLIFQKIGEKLRFKRYKMIENLIFKWKKFLFLTKREQSRSSKKITQAIRMMNFRKRLRYNLLRKLYAGNFSNKLALVAKALLFRVLVWKVKYCHSEKCCDKLFSLLYRKNVASGFKNILLQSEHQKKREKQLKSLEQLLVIDKIGSKYWKKAHVSVRFSNFIGPKLKNGLFSWESIVDVSKTRRDKIEDIHVLKAFRVIVAMYRSKVRTRRDLIKNFSSINFRKHIIGRGILQRHESRIKISSQIRSYIAKKKCKERLSTLRRFGEFYKQIVQKRQNNLLRFVFLYSCKRVDAVIRMKHWFNVFLAKRIVNKKRIANANSNAYEAITKYKNELKILRAYLYKMMRYYSSSPFSSTVPRTFSTERPISFEVSSASFTTRSWSQKLPRKVRSAMNKSLNPVHLDDKYLDFQSSEFYNHLFKIKKTGIFNYDGKTNNISANELAYCVKASKVIFCPYVTDPQLSKILDFFCGHKLVLCGGEIFEEGMDSIIRYLTEMVIKDGIVLHLNNVSIEYSQLQKMVFLLKRNSFPWLRELSVDITTFKILELMSLFDAFSVNSTIQRLFVDFEGRNDIVNVFSPLFKLLKPNTVLEEINILGAELDSSAIDGLCYSCLRGLPSLRYLKLSCSDTATALLSGKNLVAICKERIKLGKGVSVVFDSSVTPLVVDMFR